MRTAIIKTLTDSSVRLCLRAGYDASQKGLNIDMLVNTGGEEFSKLLTESIVKSLELLEAAKQPHESMVGK